MQGDAYLGWARDLIHGFLGDTGEALFIPYAAVAANYDGYGQKVREALAAPGFRVESIHTRSDPMRALRDCRAILVGGGNTFRLLERLQTLNLLDAIRQRVCAGTPYVGWSAGSNVACPTIRTTNDMPIVEPKSLDALGLVPFQINPHFTDKTIPNFGGETRAERLQEFVTLNPGTWVVGLREGDWIEVRGTGIVHGGQQPMEIFHSSGPRRTLWPGSDLSFLGRDG